MDEVDEHGRYFIPLIIIIIITVLFILHFCCDWQQSYNSITSYNDLVYVNNYLSLITNSNSQASTLSFTHIQRTA